MKKSKSLEAVILQDLIKRNRVSFIEFEKEY